MKKYRKARGKKIEDPSLYYPKVPSVCTRVSPLGITVPADGEQVT